jgi:hypothetical protein
VDLILTMLIGVIQLALGVMGAYVSFKPPKPEHHGRWIKAFIGIGLIGVILTCALAKRAGDAQEANTLAQEGLRKEVEGEKEKLEQSLLEQTKTTGELNGIKTVMLNFSKSGIPGFKEVADAILKIGKQAEQQNQNIRLSRKELATKAHTLARNLRDFRTQAEKQQADSMEQFYRNSQPKTDDERKRVANQRFADVIRLHEEQTREFENTYMAQAKNLRDSIFELLPIEKRDFLREHNSQADMNLEGGTAAGANNKTFWRYI